MRYSINTNFRNQLIDITDLVIQSVRKSEASCGLVNVFVPSGGGQWAVQGPIMLPAGVQLGVDPVVSAMAIAWGDAWTNMIQPFWALPLLGIVGLDARSIMGYCLIALVYSGLLICTAFLFFI